MDNRLAVLQQESW